MRAKPTKLVGLSLDNFQSLLAKGDEICVRRARLLPFYTSGSELALTSIFLSALRLVSEFQRHLFYVLGVKTSKDVRVYTEAEFLHFEKKRADGLILVVRGGRIVDAVILEVKNKNSELNERQMAAYVEIANAYGIPKVLTISNQFVSSPSQSPLNLRMPRSTSLFHFSWSYILTTAHILLSDNNNNNIEDSDQIELMREVVDYFESRESGIVGFSQMKPGWVELTKKANARTALKLSDQSVEDTVSSWLQEECDMALILSRELGLFVNSGHRKFRNDLIARINYEKKELVSKSRLESTLLINGAASPLKISPDFARKNISMSAALAAPKDKGQRGQLSWIRNQLSKAERSDPTLFASLKPDLIIEIYLKYVSEPIRVHLAELDQAFDRIAGREITGFGVLYFKYLGRDFDGRKRVVEIVEKMLIDYYQGVLQHLKRWEKPAPKIGQKPEPIDSTLTSSN